MDVIYVALILFLVAFIAVQEEVIITEPIVIVNIVYIWNIRISYNCTSFAAYVATKHVCTRNAVVEICQLCCFHFVFT